MSYNVTTYMCVMIILADNFNILRAAVIRLSYMMARLEMIT